MKKEFVLSTLFLTAGISFSSNAFVPMVEEGKTWWYEIGSVVTEDNSSPEKYEIGLTLGEKVTLEDREWNKLFIIDRDGTKYERPVGYLREADGRVYFRDEMTYQFLSDYREDYSEDVFAYIKYYLYPPFSDYDPYDFVTPARCWNTQIYDFNQSVGEDYGIEYIEPQYWLEEIMTSDIFPGRIIQKWHSHHVEPTSSERRTNNYTCTCPPSYMLYCIEGIGGIGKAGFMTFPNSPNVWKYEFHSYLPPVPVLKSITDADNRVLYSSTEGAMLWTSGVFSTLEVSPEYRKNGNTLVLNNLPEGAEVEIISASGLRYLHHSESTSLEIATDALSAGVYLVNIRKRNEQITTFRITLGSVP